MHRLTCWTGLAISWGLMGSAVAHAEGARASMRQDDAIDEIVVTASKRPEDVQRVAGSISTLGAADLEKRGITDFAGLATQIPGLTYGEIDGATFVTIRGVGAAVDNGIAEPSVATYVDGVFLSRSTMGNLDFQDLERVELLRGPQGTLYGRNATGGAVNFISRKPTDTLTAGGTMAYGNYDDRLASAFVSGPLTDSVRFRVSGGGEKRDGYVKNIVGSQDIANVDRSQVRGALELLPSSGMTVNLSALYQRDDSRNAYQQQLTSPTSPLVPEGTVSTNRPWRIASDFPYRQEKSTTILSGTVDWDLGGDINLRSVSGYVDHHISSTLDGDATSYGLVNVVDFERPTKTLSQEFNLFGETGPLKWLVGAYYFHEHFEVSENIPLPNGVPGALPPGTVSFMGLDEQTDAYALFADLTYGITDSLRLNFGLRWNREKKEFLQTAGAIFPDASFFGASDVPSDARKSKLLPKVGLQYDVSPDINVYMQYQIGQKSGGQNLGVLNTPFLPEELTAYEVGLKTRLFNGSATLNASGFYYDYSNLQVFKVVQGTTSVVENADAEIYGLDVDLTARVGPLRANAGVSLLDTKYTKFQSIDPFDPLAGLQDLKGNRLTRAPDYTINAGLEWAIPINQSGLSELTLRGEVYRSGRYALSAFANQPGEPQSGYTIGNLSAILAVNDHIQFKAFVDNLTNEEQLVSKLYSPLQGSFLGAYAPPRMYGVEAKFEF